MNPQRLQRILIDHSASQGTAPAPGPVPWHTDDGVTPQVIEALRASLTPLQCQHCASGHEPTAPNSAEDQMQKRMERFGTTAEVVAPKVGGGGRGGGAAIALPRVTTEEEQARVARREARFGTGAPPALTDDRVAARLAKFGAAEAPPPPPTNTDERMKEREARFGKQT